VRLVVDLSLRLPKKLQIFDKKQKTIVLNALKNEEQENVLYYKLGNEQSLVNNVLKACFELQLQSILIEGGTKLLQSFIDEHCWDEARIIENSQLIIENGLSAPQLSNHEVTGFENIFTDSITYYKNLSPS
jgi:diaminohydroxyphosphoribosylaminopyrimidine deaminase/5-amino-6-(5-phosphoribosylamino)uracil reductase